MKATNLKKSMFVENANTNNISLSFKEYEGFLTGDLRTVDVYGPDNKTFITTLTRDQVINNAQSRDAYFLVPYSTESSARSTL